MCRRNRRGLQTHGAVHSDDNASRFAPRSTRRGRPRTAYRRTFRRSAEWRTDHSFVVGRNISTARSRNDARRTDECGGGRTPIPDRFPFESSAYRRRILGVSPTGSHFAHRRRSFLPSSQTHWGANDPTFAHLPRIRAGAPFTNRSDFVCSDTHKDVQGRESPWIGDGHLAFPPAAACF
jgi:hypothetical protein